MHAAPEPEAPPADLPDMREVPPDDRERVWYERYYQRGARQLTFRAVVMGGFIGMVMSVCNLYTTLKLGWAFGVAITACVLSYAIWNSFVALGLAKTKMTILENNCMQSTASAAGYSTGGTLATAAGALLLISGDSERMGWGPLAIWVFLVAMLGVFLAIPMKRQMINHEQLPFPSGIAAAETLRSLYAEGEAAAKKARALIDAMIAGAGIGLFRSFGVLPPELAFGSSVRVGERMVGLGQMGMSFEPSVLLVAAGMITGMRVCVSMLIAAIINWVILTPMLLDMPTWTGDPSGAYVGHMPVGLDKEGAITVVKVTKWSLWLGTSILVSSGLTSFALGWRTILRAFSGFGRRKGGEDPLAAIEVPGSWLVAGLLPVAIGLAALCWFAWGINPALGLVSVVLSGVLSLVACRATGETDTTPVGAMGKITQFIYAVLSPADKTVNLLTAGVTAGAASSSADLLTDLKSGYLLGANPRQQFLAQFAGVFFGVVAIIPMWYIMVPDKATLERFNPPATNMWYAVAQALSNGVDTIPTSARWAIVVGALIGIAFPVLENLVPKARRFLPSTMGLGLALVISFSASLGFFLGALIASRWAKSSPRSHEDYMVPVASGAIAGESLAAAGYAILNSAHIIEP